MSYFYIVLILIIVLNIFQFNKIVRAKNMIYEAYSGVDIQLKKRHDLIPNLLEVVKAYSDYEKKLINRISSIHYESIKDSNIQHINSGENEVTQALRSIFTIVESYPEIKANNSFLDLQKNLVEIEDQLQLARRYFNGTVRDYNILIETFPRNIMASLFKYKKEEFFEIEFITQKDNVGVDLNSENR